MVLTEARDGYEREDGDGESAFARRSGGFGTSSHKVKLLYSKAGTAGDRSPRALSGLYWNGRESRVFVLLSCYRHDHIDPPAFQDHPTDRLAPVPRRSPPTHPPNDPVNHPSHYIINVIVIVSPGQSRVRGPLLVGGSGGAAALGGALDAEGGVLVGNHVVLVLGVDGLVLRRHVDVVVGQPVAAEVLEQVRVARPLLVHVRVAAVLVLFRESRALRRRDAGPRACRNAVTGGTGLLSAVVGLSGRRAGRRRERVHGGGGRLDSGCFYLLPE
ncbi:hypothetical protein GGR56DRAFT_132383 [Xylariaceae sp. FL0804]|nr:hypothetical protein GGR56DRAFT_132383 [Xylariaceae sp. FL0804]